MKASVNDIVWMVDGSRLKVVEVRSKYIVVEDGRKILSRNLNRQHKSQLLLELQSGVKEFP